jgi:hypothetical protein
MVGGGLATMRHFKQPLLMVRVASSGAPASGIARCGAGDPPPNGGSVRESLE